MSTSRGDAARIGAGPPGHSHQSDVPVGTIALWPRATAPTGWHLCNGSTHSSDPLYDLIGSTVTPTLTDYGGQKWIIKKV